MTINLTANDYGNGRGDAQGAQAPSAKPVVPAAPVQPVVETVTPPAPVVNKPKVDAPVAPKVETPPVTTPKNPGITGDFNSPGTATGSGENKQSTPPPTVSKPKEPIDTPKEQTPPPTTINKPKEPVPTPETTEKVTPPPTSTPKNPGITGDGINDNGVGKGGGENPEKKTPDKPTPEPSSTSTTPVPENNETTTEITNDIPEVKKVPVPPPPKQEELRNAAAANTLSAIGQNALAGVAQSLANNSSRGYTVSASAGGGQNNDGKHISKLGTIDVTGYRELGEKTTGYASVSLGVGTGAEGQDIQAARVGVGALYSVGKDGKTKIGGELSAMHINNAANTELRTAGEAMLVGTRQIGNNFNVNAGIGGRYGVDGDGSSYSSGVGRLGVGYQNEKGWTAGVAGTIDKRDYGLAATIGKHTTMDNYQMNTIRTTAMVPEVKTVDISQIDLRDGNQYKFDKGDMKNMSGGQNVENYTKQFELLFAKGSLQNGRSIIEELQATGSKFVLYGKTDAFGSDEHNQRLSQQRVDNMVKIFTDVAKSKGMTQEDINKLIDVRAFGENGKDRFTKLEYEDEFGNKDKELDALARNPKRKAEFEALKEQFAVNRASGFGFEINPAHAGSAMRMTAEQFAAFQNAWSQTGGNIKQTNTERLDQVIGQKEVTQDLGEVTYKNGKAVEIKTADGAVIGKNDPNFKETLGALEAAANEQKQQIEAQTIQPEMKNSARLSM